MDDKTFKQFVLTDKVLIINPGRILDNNNAHLMAQHLSDAKSKGLKFVIMDMAELEFLSSAGVGSILGSIEDFRGINGDIILCNASSTILHVFKVLDLDNYLTIKLTQEEALSFCK